jgi:hypothetical protein
MGTKLLRGVTPAAKKKLLAAASKNEKHSLQEYQKRQQKKPAELQAANQEFYAKAEAALKKDAKYSAYLKEAGALNTQYQNFLVDYQRNPQAKKAQLDEFGSKYLHIYQKYQPIFVTALNFAGGQDALARNLATQVEKWKQGYDLGKVIAKGGMIDMSSHRPDTDLSLTFSPPYDDVGMEVLGQTSASVTASDGAITAGSRAYMVGSSTAHVWVGSFFTCPENRRTDRFITFTVKTKLKMEYFIRAAGIAGAAGSDADLALNIVYPDGGVSQSEVKLESVLAMILFGDIRADKETYEIEMKGSFNPGPERELLLRLGLRSSSWSGGLTCLASNDLSTKIGEFSLTIERL